MTRVVFILTIGIALTGCGGAAPQDAAAIPAAANRRTTSINPVSSIAPSRAVYDAMPDFNGLGPLRFGMDAQRMHKVWTRPLYGEPPANDLNACYYLRPRKDDYGLLLMMESGKFVRVEVRKDPITAPGGGRVGMAVDALRKLYAARIEAAPNKYDPAAQTLRVASPHGELAWLVFEADANGIVKSWRIGLLPQVDYVEGCS